MAITLNKVIGRSSSGKIQYDRAGSPTNPYRTNTGSLIVNKPATDTSAVTKVSSPAKVVTRTETINGEKLQISIKPATTDTLGNSDDLSQQAGDSSPISTSTLLLLAAAAYVVMK